MMTTSVRTAAGLMATVATLALGGCEPPGPADATLQIESVPSPESQAKVSTEGVNALTAKEAAEGWTLLFDGETLEPWRGFKMEGIPFGWSADEGKIHLRQPDRGQGEGEAEEGERADLITRERYASFDLKLDWAVTPGGNSGVFFHVSEDRERTYHTGPEVQILDDDLHPDGKKPETSAGSNYALHAPSADVVKPLGEWNSVRLRVEGDRVTHWLNGTQIVDYRLRTDDWKERVAASKFASMPGYGLNQSGHIALQDHGDELWFRSLRILVLDPDPEE